MSIYTHNWESVMNLNNRMLNIDKKNNKKNKKRKKRKKQIKNRFFHKKRFFIEIKNQKIKNRFLYNTSCDTANEHALTGTRETSSCSQTVSNGTNDDDLYIRIATVGTLFRQLTPPRMIHTRVLLVTQRSYRSQTQQHTDSTKRSVPGWERTYNALVSTLCVSTLPTMPARHKIRIIR